MTSRTLFLLSLLLAGAGCSASQVDTTAPETQAYAPENLRADGEVSYLNAGAKKVRNARRDDAFRKMHAACSGPYEIVREEEQRSMLVGGPQRRIWFRCLEEEAEPEAPEESVSEDGGLR